MQQEIMSKNNNNNELSSSPDLPEVLWFQIFLLLPLKMVGVCACVCKAWKEIIKKHSFVCSYIQRALSSPINQGAIENLCFLETSDWREGEFYYSLHIGKQELQPYKELDPPFQPRRITLQQHQIKTIGCSNGLICLADFRVPYHKLMLWNPTIRKSIHIMSPPSEGVFGFGFDPKLLDYKVMNFMIIGDTIGVHVYSLNSNSWKKIVADKKVVSANGFINKKVGIFINGVVHLVAYKILKNNRYSNFILGFDVSKERFSKIKLPGDLVHVLPFKIHLLATLDEESIMVSDYDQTLWVMLDYGSDSSWSEMLIYSPFAIGESLKSYLAMDFNGAMSYSPDLGISLRDIMEGRELSENAFVYLHSYVQTIALMDKDHNEENNDALLLGSSSET